jgi:hypothetical protein
LNIKILLFREFCWERDHGTLSPIAALLRKKWLPERLWDMKNRLLNDRVIFIGTQINDFIADTVFLSYSSCK